MNDFAGSFQFYPQNADGSYNTRGSYNPLTFAKQPFKGRAMTETMMSDSKAGVIFPDEPLAPIDWRDHRTAHVTYFYQGSVRSDNT